MRKLLDEVRGMPTTSHFSIQTEHAYVLWINKFILFHGKRHPAEMVEVEEFLTHPDVEKYVAASTQDQAFSALPFLYGGGR